MKAAVLLLIAANLVLIGVRLGAFDTVHAPEARPAEIAPEKMRLITPSAPPADTVAPGAASIGGAALAPPANNLPKP